MSTSGMSIAVAAVMLPALKHLLEELPLSRAQHVLYRAPGIHGLKLLHEALQLSHPLRRSLFGRLAGMRLQQFQLFTNRSELADEICL
jgi:hypothetical protein